MENNPVAITLVLLAIIAIIIFVLYKFSGKNANRPLEGDYTIDDKYNTDKVEREKEMNRILDKIGKSGVKSLTRSEKEMLDKFSDKN